MPKHSLTRPTAVQPPTPPAAPGGVIGIDVCKAALDGSSASSRRPWQIPNEPKAIKVFLQSLPANAHLIVEATGRYEEALVDAAHQAGITISVLNPLWVRRFAESRGILLKSDRADAKTLRLYGESTPCRPTLPVPPELRALTALATLREELVKIQTQLRNSTEHLTHKTGCRAVAALLQSTKKQIAKLTAEAQALIARTPALATRAALLLAQYGVAEVTTNALLCWLPELGTLNRQQIAHLAGLAPQANESGPRQGKRRVRGGRPKVRRALYLATLTAIRQPGSFLQGCYQHLRAAGKPTKVALLATARKFLLYLNSLFQKAALPPLLPNPSQL